MESLNIQITGITATNTFTLSYKTGDNVGCPTRDFIRYPNSTTDYSSWTDSIIVSGITINYDTQYWFKIQDIVTGQYIIENINTNNIEHYRHICLQCVLSGTATVI